VLSKCELTGSEEVRQRLQHELSREVLAVSAVTGQGLSQLVRNIVKLVDATPVEAET
jgi:hypothetical protein